jgi:benzoyl-CoA 2,3-dioxygenase component B
MFTYFTDRDGKFQLKCLAESGFDPLARTCRFMLTEEAYHMSVGMTGLGRVLKRCVEVMKEIGSDDPAAVRRAGAIDLPTFQRYINFWFTSSLDLFGSEISSNAATTFANGIKGRPDEDTAFQDHDGRNATVRFESPDGQGGIKTEDVPLRNAINETVRVAYIADCLVGLNRTLTNAGLKDEIKLPSLRFNRTVGVWAGQPVDPSGRLIARDAWERQRSSWLPSEADRAFVRSLMKPVREPGKVASWLAPPERGVGDRAVEHEYVRL